MKFGIFVHHIAGDEDAINAWVVDHDSNAAGGKGFTRLSQKKAEAKTFNSSREAIDFYNEQSTVQPLRPDGEPNRPMTAYTVSIRPVDEF